MLIPKTIFFLDSARGFENCPIFLHKVALNPLFSSLHGVKFEKVTTLYRPGIGGFQAVSKCLHGGMFGSSGLWEICLFRHIIEDLSNLGLGYRWHFFGAMVEHLEKGLWILQISKQSVPMAACSSHSGIEHLMQASRSYSVGAQRKVNSEGLKSSWWTKKEYGKVISDICNFLNMCFFLGGFPFGCWITWHHLFSEPLRLRQSDGVW